MRPIKKNTVGQNVSYMASDGNVVSEIIQPTYSPYSRAKFPLVGCIGDYCSYCELEKEPGDLAVEHVAAKSRGGSKIDWDNFLLACNVCNSDKGAQLINIQDSHWPHVNNTFLSFVYDASGRVYVNPTLKGLSKSRAEKLYDICKFERHPLAGDMPSASDFRWRKRFEAWNQAVRDKGLYQRNVFGVDDVLSDALSIGFWSVWFTVFRGEDAVRRELINRFPGTDAGCFDPSNHYDPVFRNPHNPYDPI